MMQRDRCLQILAEHIPNEIVVAVYSAAFDWVEIRPHALNYFSVGAMGLGSSHALGLALGCPQRKVVLLDGDGSLLMNLGSCVTIANSAPPNLYHFLCENGTYEVNGAHPIPGQGTVSFAGLAKAAGYPVVHEFSDLVKFESEVPNILAGKGPAFVDLKVVPGERQIVDFDTAAKMARELYAPAGREAFRLAMKQAS
jgi:sulfopyruvate decarboxylase subunit beta